MTGSGPNAPVTPNAPVALGEPPITAWIGLNRGFAPLFSDPAIAALFGTEATLAAMLDFERALTRALGASGAVDGASAEAALQAMEGFAPDLAAIERASLTDGLPVPEFVRQLKQHVSATAGDRALAAVHIGATSQDLLDTGLAITLRDASDILVARIEGLMAGLDALNTEWGDCPLMGRTRMQAALPITVDRRIAAWRAPFPLHLERLDELTPRIARVQFGGPVGRRTEPEGKANEIAHHMARELGLHDAPCWHTDRSGVVEFGQWLALVCGSLAKIGQDVALMSQQGLNEIELTGGGTSSAMAHKRNPVLAEHLVAQARFAAGLAGTLHHAAIHEQERSGAAWALEWMTLPLLTETCGAALGHARRLIASIGGMGGMNASRGPPLPE